MPEEIRIILKNGEPHSISDFNVQETINILLKSVDRLTKCLQVNTLEPCPFCGAEIGADDIHYIETMNNSDAVLCQVICPKCGACGPVGYSDKRSAEHWNVRKQKGNNDEDQ